MTEERSVYMMTRYQAFHFQCPTCKRFAYAQFSALYDEEGTILDYYWCSKTGESYLTATFQKKFACCGVPLRSRMVRGKYDPSVKCDDKCFSAKSKECSCTCGGLMHGIWYSQEEK
jgi:hypothetical protein